MAKNATMISSLINMGHDDLREVEAIGGREYSPLQTALRKMLPDGQVSNQFYWIWPDLTRLIGLGSA